MYKIIKYNIRIRAFKEFCMNKKNIIVALIIILIISLDYLYTRDYLPVKYHKSAKEVIDMAHAKCDVNDYRAAIRLYKQALRLHPYHISAVYHDIGACYLRLNLDKKAIEPLTKSILFDPRNGSSYYTRGLAYYYSDQADKAKADFLMAIRINKPGASYEIPNSYSHLASIEHVNKNYAKSMEYINKYESLTSQDKFNLVSAKMDIISKTQSVDKAIAYAKKIEPKMKAANDKNLQWLYYDWGNLLTLQNKHREAIKKFEQTIEINPNHEYAYSEACDSYAALGDGENAIKYCQRANAVFPHGNGYTHTCRAYYVAKQYDKALHYCDLLINNDMEMPLVYYYRALIYKELNRTEDAKQDLAKAKDLLMNWEEGKSLTESNYTMQKGDTVILKMIDDLSKSL